MSRHDSPPRPEIAPGHGGPIRTPNNNDVLSGRGGRINSHTGNVRFREMVDSLKRDYLDPRTKKIEKARIAARLVATIRHSNPPGRFLKEDPHTGLWIEIGDERAWKKAGQALRESAPEIRAEQQAQLQAAAERAGGVIAGLGTSPAMRSSMSPPDDRLGREMSCRRQTDPPGPRHRPNPPEREGLTRSRDLQQQQLYEYEQQVYKKENKFGNNRGNNFEGENYDNRLERMRQEYYLQQCIQAEYAKRQGNEYHGNGYDDYNYQQQQYMLQQQHQNQEQIRRSYQEIAATMMNDDLLPVDAGFIIPSLGGVQQYNEQQSYQQCYPVHRDNYGPSADQTFNGQQFNPISSCDKTVSTMSTFGVQSMDMSSLGGSSFANHGLAQPSMVQKKSPLERKLEKVNDSHHRQQLEQMEKRRTQAMQAHVEEHGNVCMEVPTKRSSNDSAQNKDMMNSLASFGFEDIAEEDHFEESSVKMSNLGLSEMEMTFNSDIISIKSKVDKISDSHPEEDSQSKAVNHESCFGSNEKRNSLIPDSVDSNKEAENGGTASNINTESTSESNSNRGSLSSNVSMKRPSLFDLDNFNESLRSMDLEDRGPVPPDPPSNADDASRRTRPVMGNASFAPRRRQREPTGGSLPSLAAREKSVERGKPSVSESAATHADFGISDPNITAEDFGISLNSIRSFNSHDSDTSSWLEQYQSMENVTGGMNPWDEEGSNGSSLSEISAPRMAIAN